MLAVMTEVQEGKHHLNSLKINLKTRIHYSFFPALMKLDRTNMSISTCAMSVCVMYGLFFNMLKIV